MAGPARPPYCHQERASHAAGTQLRGPEDHRPHHLPPHLLDWHRDWYAGNSPGRWATGRNPAVYQAEEGAWRLTTGERKRILLNCIYGVDIDAQAVEVTKLSLLLKVLEGENTQTLDRQLRFFRERALPDLGSNIKCGNSLIGTDFYSSQSVLSAGGVSEEEMLREDLHFAGC